jgi:glycosyltransferase involved in cell wall biosynthesis
MKIALIGEGTYPHQFGGVSVWCDQLIRGMPDYDFSVVALVATGEEPLRWELPENVDSLTTVALWGAPPAGSRRSWRAGAAIRPLLTRLLDVVLLPPTEGEEEFESVVRELADFAKTRDLSAALSGDAAVRSLMTAWRERMSPLAEIAPAEVTPKVGDAVAAMRLLEHSLRPLSHDPVRTDVLHVVTNGSGALPAIVSKWEHGTPMLLTEHGIYLREQYAHHREFPHRWPAKEFFFTWLRRLCTLGYKTADTIAPGNVYNRRWEERLGADPARLRTVYNGVDPADFPAVGEEPEVPTISWAGRIDPVKDLETLIRAFALLHDAMPTARLRIFGAPPPGREAYLQHCQSLVGTLALDTSVTFEGWVADIRDAYAAAHVVVLSSVTEGVPYTVIEAMTCGRPCVATDVGGVAEAVGDTGFVVPPRSPAAIAEACRRLLLDDELRHHLGDLARRRALEYFTVDRAISAYDEMYSFLGTGRPLPTIFENPIPVALHTVSVDTTEEIALIGEQSGPTSSPIEVPNAARANRSGKRPIPKGKKPNKQRSKNTRRGRTSQSQLGAKRTTPRPVKVAG